MLIQKPQVLMDPDKQMRAGIQKGFTLIEILITLFILAIGLLGLASMLFEGMRNNQGSYLRTQASILAYDMTDRMRANKAQANSYQGFATNDPSTVLVLPTCATEATGCTPANQVARDLAEWTRQIQSVGSGITMVPGGVGLIQFDAVSNAFTITVQWQEASRGGDAGEQIAGDSAYSVRFTL